ncbi:hypothetical protein AGMMS49960_20230 [Betaproteobacteria bacterium]|nr:hypothetical protein AGMMS49543_16400 [Betaproteobacteria bacterium]GHU04486.1 hypothetical protein AGMMS49960_20230 [Betaproteobacteria bacterium]GHU24237.1 hypothetical protein AGMMS50243_27060 [Betaproteobacteria bacterium]
MELNPTAVITQGTYDGRVVAHDAITGNPGMIISPAADGLVQALAGKYRYKVNAKGAVADTLEKSHPFSDYVDSIQYACLHHDAGATFGWNPRAVVQEIEHVDYAWV